MPPPDPWPELSVPSRPSYGMMVSCWVTMVDWSIIRWSTADAWISGKPLRVPGPAAGLSSPRVSFLMNNEKQRLLLIVLFMFGWVLLPLSRWDCSAHPEEQARSKAKAAVNEAERRRRCRGQEAGRPRLAAEARRGAGQDGRKR